MGFPGVDFYQIDELLTQDELIARDAVRKFVDDQVIPIIEEHFEAGTFPKKLVAPMAEIGLLGPTIPEEYGGAGASYTIYGLMMMELERGDSGIRSFSSVQSSLVMYPLYTFGSEEHRKKYLPKLASGALIGAFGLTEPDHGSDPGSMSTKAVRDGKHYVLNGAKMWITNAGQADVAVVWAKLDGTVRGFVVEAGTPGFKQIETKHKFSLRASVTGELVFEDCKLPLDNLLPKSDGLKSPLMCLNQARYGIAWGGIGAGMACYEAARQYAIDRKQFERPIAGYQLVQAKLTNMLTEITKGQLLAWRLGKLMDAKKAKHYQVSMAKMNNVSAGLQIARVARDIHGANGITLEYPIVRHMLNLESVNTYEGTEDIHRLIIGREITGLDAFSSPPK